jgi:predicted  nucleic acid-binding Zn-ribbon protein
MTQLSGDCFREGHIIRAARAALAIEGAARRRGIATLTAKLPQIEAEAEEARQARERLRQDRDTLQRQLETARHEVANLRAELLAIREFHSPKKDDELSAELERAWDENHRLQVEIEAGRKRVAELAEHLRAAQENLAQLWQSPDDLSLAIPSEERSFTSVAAALSAATTEFGDILTVWEEAVRSAEQSLFASPDQVYRALLAIVEVGRDYFSARAREVAGGPLDRVFQKRIPFKYTGFESATTLSRYGADRVFRHGELSLQMQRHLTLGGGQTNNCLQIFFEFEDMNQRVLIGYCGRHLPYAGQRS